MTQGDPAALAIKIITIIPMILILIEIISNIPNNKKKLTAHADDISTAQHISILNV